MSFILNVLGDVDNNALRHAIIKQIPKRRYIEYISSQNAQI